MRPGRSGGAPHLQQPQPQSRKGPRGLVRSSNCRLSSRNYACAASLRDDPFLIAMSAFGAKADIAQTSLNVCF